MVATSGAAYHLFLFEALFVTLKLSSKSSPFLVVSPLIPSSEIYILCENYAKR